MPVPVAALPESMDSFHGTTGTALFFDLTRWREALARSIARNNLAMRSAGIAIATNRIILALVFLRIAEDRGLLPAGTLGGLAGSGDSRAVISRLLLHTAELYRNDDPSMNPAVGPEVFGDLIVDDRVMESMLREITSDERKYDLAILTDEVLAQVFSRYLSRTIRRSATHQATIVDTHDTVLSRGTVIPTLNMHRYMVGQAAEAVLNSRSRRDPLPIRLLDPACGSGCVLIAVYNSLLSLNRSKSLTFEERKEILFQSIYGVDISIHAVAVTRMLLFFAALGGVCRELTVDFYARAWQVFHLLRHTIRCGNALIGPEITRDESWTFCPERDRHNLNLFAWNEQFPEIRTSGGFDAVISNPPEGPAEDREWIQQYFQRHYTTYHPVADRSAYFAEKGLGLVRNGGTISLMMSTRWLRGTGGSPLRSFLKTRQIAEIAEFCGTGLCVLRFRNVKPAIPFTVVRGDPEILQDGMDRAAGIERFPVDQSLLDDGGWSLADSRAELILAKIERAGTPFEEFCMGEIGCGSVKQFDERLLLDAATRDLLVKRDRRSVSLLRPYIRGQKTGRYYAEHTRQYLLVIPSGWLDGKAGEKNPLRWLRDRFPAVARHLKNSVTEPEKSPAGEMPWYEIQCRDVFRTRDQPKIIFPCKSPVPVFTYDTGKSIIDRETGYLVTANLYLLGILNSRLIRFWFLHRSQQKKNGDCMITAEALAGLYVHTPDFDNPGETDRCCRTESLVKKILLYHEHVARDPDETKKELFRKKIERTDRQIDLLVYELYGMTMAEIGLVESVTIDRSPS
jgi:hypothetical protein